MREWQSEFDYQPVRFAGMEVNGYKIEPRANLAGVDLSGATLRRPNQSGRKKGVDLTGANLAAANLAGANLADVHLS